MGEAYTQKLRARSPGTKTTKIKDWWWVLRKKIEIIETFGSTRLPIRVIG